MLVDWNAQQFLAMIAPYLQKYGKAKKNELASIVGNHITDKQLRSFLNQLRAIDFIKTEGERGQMVYMLGDAFFKNADIIIKALNIGLEALKNKGEI